MAEKKVYSTTVLGAKPHRGRPAQKSAEVQGNVEYKESKSKPQRSEAEKKVMNSVKVGMTGAFIAGALADSGVRAADDYRASRSLQRNRAGRRQYRTLKPDNIQ